MASLQQQGLRRNIRISDGVTSLIGIGNQIGHGKIDFKTFQDVRRGLATSKLDKISFIT